MERLIRFLRLTLNRELNQAAYNWQTIKPKGAPEAFQIELTNDCPMTCVMCPRTRSMTRAIGYMDATLFRHVVREVSQYSSKIFLHHFGDSLIHPQLGELIEFARKHGMQTYLSGNPNLLTNNRIHELVDYGLYELVLSLDGVSAATSEAIRGRAASNVEEAERKVRSFLEYRKARNMKTPYLILQFVRQKMNQHETASWLAKWKTVKGIDVVKVKTFVSWDGHDDRINDLRIDSVPEPNVVCDKPWTSVTVLWDGRVVPCCFDYDGLYVLGNLSKQSIRELWSSEAACRLRQAHRDQTLDDIKLCARCTDKEGYSVGKWYYPLNRFLSQRMPLGDEDVIALG
ncbi:MAG: SPASM domain-containing protein [Desulfatitalea sp.]|nr:SPASM domain-containing protein [Desulfatitalea sp.]